MSKKFPKKPRRLWMLWCPEINDYVRAVDDPPGADAFLCATSKKDAIALKGHQEDGYEIESVVVKVI